MLTHHACLNRHGLRLPVPADAYLPEHLLHGHEHAALPLHEPAGVPMPLSVQVPCVLVASPRWTLQSQLLTSLRCQWVAGHSYLSALGASLHKQRPASCIVLFHKNQRDTNWTGRDAMVQQQWTEHVNLGTQHLSGLWLGAMDPWDSLMLTPTESANASTECVFRQPSMMQKA